MEKFSQFLVNHWIIVLIINLLAISFIIGYIIETIKIKKKKVKVKKNIQESKAIFDIESSFIDKNKQDYNKNTEITSVNSNILKEKDIDNKETIKENIITKSNESINTLETNDINKINNDTKQQIHNNIDYIINQSNSVFEEFDKVIPEKKIIDEELKEELESFNVEIKPIKNQKKDIDIDTNIELPEIELSTEEEDIWS